MDDYSSVPIAPIVKEMADPRFRYVRNNRNGGPYNARVVGYKIMRGDYLFHLDSDWQLFPWALGQAVHYLDTRHDVDGVAGMHLRDHDSCMFVRVRGVEKVITPKEYLSMDAVPDCVGAVRKSVVEEWLLKRDDYFAMEFHQWFTFSLKHNQLYVDEPWTRYHIDGQDRVSTSSRERHYEDYMKFLEEHDQYVRNIDMPLMTRILFEMWFQMLIHGRTKNRKVIEGYLHAKDAHLYRMLFKKLFSKFLALLDNQQTIRKDVFYI